MNQLSMRWLWGNKWPLVLVSIAAVALLVFQQQDALARFFWSRGAPYLAIFLNKDDVDLAMQLGNYYFGGGDYDLGKARQAYTKAITINSSVLWGHYQLARIYFSEGNFEKALEEINAELTTNPENLRSLYIRGLIYGYSGRIIASIQDFQRFTEWAPSEWAGFNDLSWILAKAGDYEGAATVAETGIRNATGGGENPWLWNSLGVAELNLKHYTEAQTAFERALTRASALSKEDWRESYPGNDPEEASGGLEEFRGAIEENLRRSRAGLTL